MYVCRDFGSELVTSRVAGRDFILSRFLTESVRETGERVVRVLGHLIESSALLGWFQPNQNAGGSSVMTDQAGLLANVSFSSGQHRAGQNTTRRCGGGFPACNMLVR